MSCDEVPCCIFSAAVNAAGRGHTGPLLHCGATQTEWPAVQRSIPWKTPGGGGAGRGATVKDWRFEGMGVDWG